MFFNSAMILEGFASSGLPSNPPLCELMDVFLFTNKWQLQNNVKSVSLLTFCCLLESVLNQNQNAFFKTPAQATLPYCLLSSLFM